MGKYNNDIIYHYCSVETFFKIIQSKVLWLSNSESMNDKFEGKWVDVIFEKIVISGNQKLPENIRKQYKELNAKKQYIICFSRNGDKASQWEGYGNGGEGIAIGFSKKALGFTYITNEVYQKDILTVSSGFIQVIYDEDIQKKLIKKILDSINKNKEVDNRLLLIKELSNKYKKPSFKEEQEVRIVYIPHNNFEDVNFTKNLSEIKFRENKNIDYYEFKLADQDIYNVELIPEIILGPKCSLRKSILNPFLKNFGLSNTEIKNSVSS